jgi:hypothetical protein
VSRTAGAMIIAIWLVSVVLAAWFAYDLIAAD